MRTIMIKILLGSALAVALIVYGCYANEARKEIYYLCGNFAPGVTLQSVVTQLDTANLSGYTTSALATGSQITFSSGLHGHYLRCVITVDEAGKVLSAVYQ